MCTYIITSATVLRPRGVALSAQVLSLHRCLLSSGVHVDSMAVSVLACWGFAVQVFQGVQGRANWCGGSHPCSSLLLQTTVRLRGGGRTQLHTGESWVISRRLGRLMGASLLIVQAADCIFGVVCALPPAMLSDARKARLIKK